MSSAPTTDSWISRAFAPVDAAALALHRILFGLLLAGGLTRFLWNGWVEILYGKPSFHFRYFGLDFVPVPSPTVITALYVGAIALALMLAAGLWTRLSAALFTLVFAWLELLDVTNYLNHYVLVTLLAGLHVIVPSGRVWSIDAWRAHRAGAPLAETAPAWTLGLLRFQVACVYLFAALAKAQPDWLLHGQPLGIWLASRTETPIIGPFLDLPGAALLFSWAGFLYDLTIPVWLLNRRTRWLAWPVLLGFHGMTAVFFDIGLFPWLMTINSLLFFPADGPRRVLAAGLRLFGRSTRAAIELDPSTTRSSRPRLVLTLLALFAATQVLVPLRGHLYGGDVLWHEQGMRLSWRVMVREKNGAITYRVRRRNDPRGADAHEWLVNPRRYLEWRQLKEMSGQPDLILQLAHHIAEDYRRRGLDVEVRVDALVSLNGRPARRLIDPDRDLTRIRDGLARADWILPAPTEPPLAAGRASSARSGG